MNIRVLYLLLLLFVVPGCATTYDLNQTNRKVVTEAYKLDGIENKIKTMHLRRQEIVTDISKLELEGIKTGKSYQSLKLKLKNIEKSQVEYHNQLITLKKQGKISNKRYKKIQGLVDQLHQKHLHQERVMNHHNMEWNRINKK